MTRRRAQAAAGLLIVSAALFAIFRDAEPPAQEPELPVPVEDAQPDEHPHPITPEHVRLQREQQLIGALNDALDLHDIGALRSLVTRYRDYDPNDAQALQAGYAVIADCLQYPGAAARERAQLYYDTERASTLRRYVRRECLE